MTRRRRVAVLMGGRSSEHPISIASARSVIAALDPERYDVVPIEIGRDGRWSLPGGQVSKSLGAGTVPATGAATLEDSNPAPEAAARGTVPATSRPQLPVPGTANEVAATLAEVEVVLPILHGPFGEDGRLQGLLEMAGVAYLGPDHAASALCMDKDLFKAVMRDQGIPVTRNVTLRDAGSVAGSTGDARREDLGGAEPQNPFGYPVFVKPARLGSSVGISKAHDDDELRAAVARAFEHDEKVLIEEFVAGVEVEVGVLGNREPVASLVGEIVVTHNEWYDWVAKYEEGEMELVVPARITEEQTLRVQQLAVQAFVATECEGIARVDCFVRDDGEVLVNELNTMPGFTATSVYAKLFEASGIPYADLLDRAIELALERSERRRGLKY
jgi:D-alanine-D-alanine ligase